MATGYKLTADTGSPVKDATQYRSIVGALQYVVITRPDVVFVVNRVCQFMQSPCDVHLQAVKRILRYLQATIDFGLRFSASPRLSLTGFAYANCGSDADDRRSTSGYCIYFAGNLVSWGSRKHAVAICMNPILRSKFKHVELDMFFVREMVAAGKLYVQEVHAFEQVVDVLTKPLYAPMFFKHRQRLLVSQIPEKSLISRVEE
ncbi:secreted RxLR effector protein 161-like [Hibiscus syriacus]|uniref:secreted RxLR effector protein 161-like n=1 Tax=Hibiscus syriacus TaxID=106335 RepID=UPI001923762E|nr:secreted RxLR effector protein 161-like [Hibiscus syriacus]